MIIERRIVFSLTAFITHNTVSDKLIISFKNMMICVDIRIWEQNMAVEKQNGDVIPFLKQKDYIMVNNDLGSGSFGKTVLLQDPFINELFVAKKYEPAYDDIQEEFYQNFLDEIRIMYKLNHRNIVRIYNYYAYENSHTGYILMEYIDGQNIGDFIENYCPPFESISLDDIFIQLIDAFCYIESKGIIHRDIREGNILIDHNGTVKVIDFGIGKIYSKNDEETDSLAGEINRAGSDTLPQEYYDHTYSNLTDMFYLAELYKRLISNSPNIDQNDFSYHDILNKMMEKQPENRFESFSAIHEAIGLHDFTIMPISEDDRMIYQQFTGCIARTLVSFLEAPKFNYDPSIFAGRLEKALSNNLFETYVQNKEDVIKCIIESRYRYRPTIQIACQDVRNFLDWFKASTPQSQLLILNNYIAKLSATVKTELEPELPF